MAAYSVAEAKNQLPKLINKARAGEEVVITRHGKPVAEVCPPKATEPSWTPEQIRHAEEAMIARRDARPPVSTDSVALFDLIYGEEEK